MAMVFDMKTIGVVANANTIVEITNLGRTIIQENVLSKLNWIVNYTKRLWGCIRVFTTHCTSNCIAKKKQQAVKKSKEETQ
jgi:septum formation inhibitor-activating ATPase MinD